MRLGFLLDLSLLVGAFLVILRARASAGEGSRSFGTKGPRAAAS
jgi:hypothetical protein